MPLSFFFSLFFPHEKSNYDNLTIDDILRDVCDFLKFDDDASERLTQKAEVFFEEESLASPLALVQTVTEDMLKEAKLRVLWVYLKDLKRKMGISVDSSVVTKKPRDDPEEEDSPKKTKKKRRKAKKALTAEQMDAKKRLCLAEWTNHGNAEDTLEFSVDARKFRCLVCYDDDEDEDDDDDDGWLLLRGPSDVRRHCIGGTSSAKNDKTPKLSWHARRMEAKKEEDEDDKNVEGEDEEDLVSEESSRESRKRSRSAPEKKDVDAGHQMELPDALPTLTSREVQPDGSLWYGCKWDGRDEEAIPIIALVAHYGEAIVAPVVEYDATRDDVDFVIEKLVKKKGRKFLVRWKGYPNVFDTWEAKSALGEHADELIFGISGT